MLRAGARAPTRPSTWRPGPDVIDGWSADAGVLLVTIAPELPGAADTIVTLREQGIVVAIGHTDGDAAAFARRERPAPRT